MAARRCGRCGTNWPEAQQYHHCPECRLATRYVLNQRAIGPHEAEQRAGRAAFERFYENWEAERERRGDLSPEALGALQARQDMAEIRQLEQAVAA
jgi:hypothetical protein